MKKIFLILIILFIAFSAHAALDSKYQNPKDLEVMVRFVKEHPRVISSLQSIDFENHTVYYAPNCKAYFGREEVFTPGGWVGPASDLKFTGSTCDENAY